MYLRGDYVDVDYQKAFFWLMKSAIQGYALAKCDIGVMYRDGEGIEQDYKKALQWLTEAADENDALAQYNIGNMYMKGLGVEKDLEKAIEWLNKAKENGMDSIDDIIDDLEKKCARKNSIYVC